MQMLCCVSRVSPLNPKKDIFWASANPNTSESVGVCSHKTHMCLFVHTGWGYQCLRRWTSVQKSRKEAQQHGKNVIWEQRAKRGTQGQERAFPWASSTIFTFVIKQRADLTVLCMTCAAGVTQRGRVWWCSFSLCTPLQNHSSTLCSILHSCERFLEP